VGHGQLKKRKKNPFNINNDSRLTGSRLSLKYGWTLKFSGGFTYYI